MPAEPANPPALDVPFTVECAPHVLQEIGAALRRAYDSAGDRREIGGVLFGRLEGTRVVVARFAPLETPCAGGAVFKLGPGDVGRLVEKLAAGRDSGLAPAGWFHSCRGELAFSGADQQFHARFFPEPWQTLLIVKPEAGVPARAAFFFPNCNGALRAGRSREFAFDAPPPPAPPAPPAAPAAEPQPARSEPPLAPDAAPRSRKLRALVALAGLAAAAAVGYQTRQLWMPLRAARVAAPVSPAPSAPAPPRSLRLVTIEEQGQLQILWDPTLPSVLRSSGGALVIADGPESNTFPIGPVQLQTGSFTYARRTRRVDVTLTITQPDGSALQQATTYMGKADRAPDAAEAPGQDVAAQVARLRADLAEQTRRAERLEQALSAARRQLSRARKSGQHGPNVQ